MKQIVVIIPVDVITNGKAIANEIANMEFASVDAIGEFFDLNQRNLFTTMDLIDFMNACNEEFFFSDGNWISFVWVPKATPKRGFICQSCEQTFDELSDKGFCPSCGSKHWLHGNIN